MGEKSGENSSAYTVGEIVALRREAEQLQLCGRSKLDSYTPAELQEICNGIGADWMPEIMPQKSFLHVFVSSLEFYPFDPSIITDRPYPTGL